MRLTLIAGVLLTAGFCALSYGVWGSQAALAAAVFGVLALVIQLGAILLVKPVRTAPIQRFMVRWGAGMGLRLLGVVSIAVAAGIAPQVFPPLAAVAGFLGVLLPLLLLEVRVIR